MKRIPTARWSGLLGGTVSAVLLSGCLATAPSVGGGSGTAASGAAAGASAESANSALEKCPETLGTLRIEENTSAGWYTAYSSRYRTGSTVPALRLLVQQSNCFVIVERGRAMQGVNQERAISRGDEGRAGSNFGGGQMVAADYTMSPEIILSDKGGSQAKGMLAGVKGLAGTALNVVAGSMSTNEASTMLLLVDNRSSVQISAAEGYSKNMDFGLSGWGFGGGSAGGASAFTSTPEGKVLMAAFMDSYNKMVVALRNYKAQTVKGGLGTGGRLGVSGGSTDASREVDQKAKKK
ncbi:peptidoglycan-binding protein [uncultured Sphaerotilus sp.]|uniref:peptidoglycan-binding protein n=1 Tax=uncultured Sphaerotilus sp. TaxID=474984 RepID=UPI0030CA264F